MKSIQATFTTYAAAIMRHHAIIAILTVLAVMILSVYAISQISSQSDDIDYRMQKEATTVRTNFDKTTIEKISRLRDRQQNVSPSLPSERINPFSE